MAINRASYKLEFQTWDNGTSAYVWTDYTSRLIKFGNIQHRAEGRLMSSFRATMGDITVDNSDSFWTAQTDTLLFNNTNESYGKKFRKRKVRISMVVPDSRGVETTHYLFYGSVDDLNINQDGTATIKVISLDRMAQEQKLDGDKINNNTIGGAWGTASCYLSRAENGETGNYIYNWHTDRRYQDYLQRVSEALNDAGYYHDDITINTGDGRRITTPLFNFNNVRANANCTLQGIYYSSLHGALLMVVSDATSGASNIKIYSHVIGTETLTSRFTWNTGTDWRIYAFWHNTETDKLFFILRYTDGSSVVQYRLYQMESDYSVSYKSLNTELSTNDLMYGVVTYRQDGDSGNGTIIIAHQDTTSKIYIEEWTCYDITTTFAQTNITDNLYEAFTTGPTYISRMGYADGDRLFFIGSEDDGATDHLYWLDIATSWSAADLYQRSPVLANRAMLDLYVDTDRVFVICYRSDLNSTYEIRYRLDTDADGAAWATACYTTGTETYRFLTGFCRGGDGLYIREYSNPSGTSQPPFPTLMLAIYDTDKTTAVFTNLLDSSNTYGEPLVDGEIGEPYTAVKVGSRSVNAEFYLAYIPGTNWKLIGYTWSPGQLLYQHARDISHYTRLWAVRDMSAWDIRVKLAEKWGAVVYYDNTGYFNFRARPSGAASKTLTDLLIQRMENGYTKVVNVARGQPYTIPYYQPKIETTKPICVRHPSSTCVLSSVSFGPGTTAAARWRVKFTSTSAFNLDEETAPGTWTNRSTGRKGTTLVYSSSTVQLTIPGSSWTGTAVAGDFFYFWAYISERNYEPLSDMERLEASDTTSIAEYQRTEISFDNRFVPKIMLPDILANIVNMNKTPRRVIVARVPLDMTLNMLDKVSFTDAYLGITTSTSWYVSARTIKYGEPDMEIELTEII